MTISLQVESLTKSYAGRVVLNDASLAVCGGEVVGLVGANGAGKTTLLRIAAGLVRPDSGRVERGDSRIVYFGGEMTLPGNVRAMRWAALFGVTSSERRLIGRLSRGTRQMVGLHTLLARPGARILLLDEPWEGLDPGGSWWLTDTIRAWQGAGAAVLVSSHRLHELEDVSSRIVMLAHGRCEQLFRTGEHGSADIAAAVKEAAKHV